MSHSKPSMIDNAMNNLPLYAIDFTSAVVSAVAVAPFVTIIDQGRNSHSFKTFYSHSYTLIPPSPSQL